LSPLVAACGAGSSRERARETARETARATARDEGVAVTQWRLSVDGDARQVPVTLPAHLDHDLPEKHARYVLRARVDVPEAMRDRALTLAIPALWARCALDVDGAPMAALDADTDDGYRGNGHPRWSIPAAQAHGPTIDLALAIDHTWTQSGWLDTVPRLSATPAGDARYLTLRTFHAVAAIGALTAAIFVLFAYVILLALDRSQRAVRWFVLEGLTATLYPAFNLGITVAIFGVYDAPVMAVMLVVTIWASVRFTHAQFNLPPPHWIWHLPLVAAIVAALLFPGPFEVTRRVAPITVAAVAINVAYQIVVTARLARVPEHAVHARVLLVSWTALGATGFVDFAAWLGFGAFAGGVRTACVGIVIIAILQSAVLSRDHVIALARAALLNRELRAQLERVKQKNAENELLNGELRRQIAARTEHLAAALGRLASSKSPLAGELTTDDVIDGRYKIVRALGRGGMGAVYEVERVADGKPFALKLLTNAGPIEMARFAREAHIVSKLDHRNVVAIADVDVATSGVFYLVMELMRGRSLHQHRERYGDVSWALMILKQIAEGLAAIHALDVVHRDLKPANVLIDETDPRAPVAKIADFGISSVAAIDDDAPTTAGTPHARVSARSVEGDAAPTNPTQPTTLDADRSPTTRTRDRPSAPPSTGRSRAHGLVDDDVDLTKTGVVMGTPRYMAPELAGGAKSAQASSDLYSFGVIAYEVLTKNAPFVEPSATTGPTKPERIDPLPLHELVPTLSRDLADVLQRCVAEDPKLRPTAIEVSAAIARFAVREMSGA
jgi:serine/threonine-protein kinase